MAPALPDGAVPWLHDFARWLGTWLYRPVFRIRIHGRERIPATGPVVLVANHSSFIEPQMLFGLVGRRAVFLVKAELGRGILGRLLRWLGQLHIRRGEPDRGPLMAAVQFLREGGLVGVFPEGRRGSGDVLQAERGAAWLVRTTGAVVLPVATRGTARPPGTGRRFRPEVDVLVGPPFALSVQRGRSGLVAGTEEIRTRLADLVREVDELRVRLQT
ncbi:MAG TPA: lysophospholipid acyltransferase family protein [Actinophytocola sp.]|uniref:lysophospholipid acyltransferase family protein n=1 Tax=Actinophytocola sp. TaxID=1872138 RepID=UPI002DDD8798|nr:lysophospholipid acyltransferase family protein [Actinophytocola sp.]HEV2780782.1 lysophospholipid acyltransferase family protein [Actinophytocola sp.]